MQELNRAMAELRDSTKRLNAITDNANALVRDVEEFLNKECSVGVYASVIVSSTTHEEHDVTFYTSLSYARVNGKYRIAIENGRDDDPEPAIRAWAECTRDEKLEALAKLPWLILEIAKIMQAATARAEETVSTVAASMAAALPKKGGNK